LYQRRAYLTDQGIKPALGVGKAVTKYVEIRLLVQVSPETKIAVPEIHKALFYRFSCF
jgi:hypothetical protein